MQELFERREQQDVARLQQVVGYAESPVCLVRCLLAHFGEEFPENFGHCVRCEEGDTAVKGSLPSTPPPEISVEQTGVIQSLLAERNGPLRTPRQLTRFLCGITSPAVTRARLSRHDAFGLLEEHAFDDVLAYCESVIIP